MLHGEAEVEVEVEASGRATGQQGQPFLALSPTTTTSSLPGSSSGFIPLIHIATQIFLASRTENLVLVSGRSNVLKSSLPSTRASPVSIVCLRSA